MKFKLLTQIFIAFILAIIFGLWVPGIEKVQPLGDLFLRLIKFVIVPLVFSTLVVGVASTGDVGKLSRMGGKTVIYYLVTTAIAITIGISAGFIFSPGEGLDIDPGETTVEPSESQGVIQTLLNIIPTNPIQSLVEGNILQIIFFALFIGIGITVIGKKGNTVYEFFDGFAEVMYKITGWVMKIAPLGVFGLIAPIVAQYGADLLMPLIKIILAVAVAVIFHAMIVYSTAVKMIGKMNPITFFKGILPATMVAFSTTSSSGTLPVTMKNTQENLKVSERVSSFVLPLGATINMDGTAIYLGISTLFSAQLFGIELTFAQLLMIILTGTLASIGTAGVPGAGLIMLTMVLQSAGLPLEAIAVVAGIDRILDMFRTAINVMGDASAAVVVASSENEMAQESENFTA
ncbi:dicarboxylate/amino acid:cation symporter [Fervidibacillus halotolerans]|uniref:Dicarboxylate/amino acid:cation symporter n=1 Tax=Fervidibacillus halotolerans TaxID=2980027 RepID=A0A9E8LZM8_9BACI|nr:dicarboxylate/amino acid:cation symporter [Fervidibacillus halotolerans]WAA12337.1 dicarboxylate/amino acid:cation symporter [Fervidibacillus halotolerans]